MANSHGILDPDPDNADAGEDRVLRCRGAQRRSKLGFDLTGARFLPEPVPAIMGLPRPQEQPLDPSHVFGASGPVLWLGILTGIFMELMDRLAEAERRIGYRFKDRELLARSLRHASSADDRLDSNERLEFLGDAILGMVVCTELFDRYPDLLEGELTKIKSNVVSRRVCAEIAEELGLGELLELGKGMNGRGEMPSSLHAAVLESIIGGMYLDGGFSRSRRFILDLLESRIEHAAKLGHQHNFKSVLQQVFQRKGLGAPSYLVLDERGPDHAKCFEVCVAAGSRQFEGCWGPNKKQAEQQAALAALLHLDLAVTDADGDIRLAEACWNDDPVGRDVIETSSTKDPEETDVQAEARDSSGLEGGRSSDDVDAADDVETLIE